MNGYDTLVSALEVQFDFHSARVIAREAVDQAGLAERQDWGPQELELAVAHVPPNGRDLRPILVKLGLASDEVASA